MPIIIWGQRGMTSTLEHGDFYCPGCDGQEEYALKAVRPWFTVYFIPLFPIGSSERFVECRGCGQAFREDVLDSEPPSEQDRFLAQLYEDFKSGDSVEKLVRRLVKEGMPEDTAEETVLKMCDDDPRECPGCGRRFHPKVRRCSKCDEKL